MPLTDRIRHFPFSCPNWWIGMLGCIILEPQLIICNPVGIPVRLSILFNSNLHSVESSYIISMRFVFQMANFTKRFDVWSCSLGMQFSFLIRKIRKLYLIICIYAIHMPKKNHYTYSDWPWTLSEVLCLILLAQVCRLPPTLSETAAQNNPRNYMASRCHKVSTCLEFWRKDVSIQVHDICKQTLHACIDA